MTFDADVVVVGCGPVGVLFGLRSVQRGLSVIAVDASTEVFPLPRAIGMDSEIQRLFEDAGLGDLVRSVSTPLGGAEFVDADLERIVGFDLPDGFVDENGHPPMAMFEQPLLERGLRAAAADAGVDLRLGVRCTGLDQDDEGVTISLDGPDGVTSLRSRWVVGADGASSTVRPLIGRCFDDLDFDQEWLVVDTTLLDDTVDMPRVARQVCDPDRVITIVPGHRDRRRWEIQFQPGDTRDSMLDPDRIRALLSSWVRPDQVSIDRAAVYRFHALVADRFRTGRVFLAGDACHQMPPFNGQGMNTGLRDAENLSWKLALVAQGACDDGLLDTYDAERRPHAAGQVAHSADAGRLIDALAQGMDFDTAAGYGGGRPFPHLEGGIRVGDHPAVGHPMPQPTVDGTPLDRLLGNGFALLSTSPLEIDAATATTWDRLGGSIVVVDDPAVAAIARPDQVIVVRPDRYVAAVADDVAETTRALADHMCVVTPADHPGVSA